jgi:tetratricopeptide (TPR) repeat protein
LATFLENENRKIIPRWREFRVTLALRELLCPSADKEPTDIPTALTNRISDWKAHSTSWFAADLVGAAIVIGRPDVALDAAELILAKSSGFPSASVAAARKILRRDEPDFSVPELRALNESTIDKRIHNLRLRLNDEPRNSIAWVDIAREYTLLGLSEQATRAIRIAVALDPVNRFVLRSAARFFVHFGDAMRAHRLIRTAPSTPYDPWLTAAEIALGSLAGGGPRFAKSGQRMIQSEGHSPSQTSELSSALGTIELENGKNRMAKKLFFQSLRRPTENAVAQAVWASKELSTFTLNVGDYDAPRTYEAKAWEYFADGKWSEALQESTNWLLDEPFAIKPAALGSYIAATALEDYRKAEVIVKAGLLANPLEPILRNNLAFILASQSKTTEAEKYIACNRQENLSLDNQINFLATRGLILFRKGDTNEGRRLYREAMEKAYQGSLHKHWGRAVLYLAREEMLANTPFALSTLKEALDATSKISDPDFQVLRERLRQLGSRPIADLR